MPRDELGMPMVAPNRDPNDPDPDPGPDPSSFHSSKNISSRKEYKNNDMDDDDTMDGSRDQMSV